MFDKGAGAVHGPGFGGSLLAAGAAGVAMVSVAALLTLPPTPCRGPVAVGLTAAASDIADAESLAESLAAAAGPASIGDAIIGFYLSVEPYAQYGANLASWAAGWIPFLGLLAPQINFFYTLDEAINRSLVFNAAYLLDGTVDLKEALNNIHTATSTAFHDFFTTQGSWLHGLLPPPPPTLPTLADAGGLPDLSELAGPQDPQGLAVPDLPSLLP